MRSILKRRLFLVITFLGLFSGGSLLWRFGASNRSVVDAASPANLPLSTTYLYYFPLISSAFAPPKLTTYDWMQFGFDSRHSGNDGLETLITPNSVSGLHALFQISLPSIADGAPVFLSSVNTNSGVRDLVFVTTKAGDIVALDAHTGLQIWSHPNTGVNYTTSSPAIDPNRQSVYSYGLDGKVHKYAVGDGTETIDSTWPETATLKPSVEKGSSALSIATAQNGTTFLYATNSGYLGDAGDYQGHVTAINLADGSQKVFNANCSDQTVHFVFAPNSPSCGAVQSAIWARPGVIYDSDTDKIYMATGNGTFAPASHDWGDTVFALSPDGTGSNGNPLDSYTPTNYQQLQDTDADLGSTAPAILPPASGKYAHLGVQGGKDSVLRLLNMDNLSGQSGTGHTGGEIFTMAVPMGGEILTQPAVWVNPNDHTTWVFISNDSGIAGLQLAIDGSGNPSLQSRWTGSGGASPIVANGIVFYARSGLVSALDPTSGKLLWSDNQIGGIHWESPIVANGILYITDESGNLTAYSK